MSVAATGQEKKPIDAYSRVVDKVRAYLKFFGMKITTVKPGNRRANIYARRGIHPPQVRVHIRETIKGTAVVFRPHNSWTSIFPGLPYFALGIFALVYQTPIKRFVEDFSSWALIDPSILLFGSADPNWYVGVICLILGIVYTIAEIVERTIRVSKLKQRFPYFTRNAIWSPSDTPTVIDVIRSTNSPFMLSYVLTVVYFSPLSLDSEILTKLISVYGISSDQLHQAIAIASFIVITFVSGMYSGAKIMHHVSFRAQVDPSSRLRGNRREKMLQIIALGAGTGGLGVLLTTMLIGALFGFPTWQFLLLLIPVLGSVAGSLGALAANEGEEWLIGFSVAYFLATDMIFVFNTGKNGGFAWLIIITLMLLLFPLSNYVMAKFIQQTAAAHDEDPQLFYSLLPVFLYVSLFYSKREKKAEQVIQKIIQTAEESAVVPIEDIERLRIVLIDKQRLIAKNPSLPSVAELYLSIISKYAAQQKEAKLIPTPEELIDWIKNKVPATSTASVDKSILLIDAALWNPVFTPSSDELSQAQIELQKILDLIK